MRGPVNLVQLRPGQDAGTIIQKGRAGHHRYAKTENMRKILLVLPGNKQIVADERVALDQRARDEFVALADTLRGTGGDHVEILDYGHIRNHSSPFVRLMCRTLGVQLAHTIAAYLCLHKFDAVFTAGETAGIPLALMMWIGGNRTNHVCLTYDISKPKLQKALRWLPIRSRMDTMIVYSDAIVELATKTLRISPGQLLLLRCHVDSLFYRPIGTADGSRLIVGSAGSDNRDFETLIRAASDLPEVTFKIVPTGFLTHLNRTAIPDIPIPPNVEFLQFERGGLREFYAQCDVIAVPVHDGLSTAGVTTLLEAMAMAKPVIASRSRGLVDFVVENQTGLSVALGDVAGWTASIRKLNQDISLRHRLGQNGRRWVERNATLDRWTLAIAGALRRAPSDRTQHGDLTNRAPHEFQSIS